MSELFIKLPFADAGVIDSDCPNDPGLRVFRSTPYHVLVQIRTWFKPTPWSKAKPKFIMANVQLKATEIDQLIERLKDLRVEVAKSDEADLQLKIGHTLGV